MGKLLLITVFIYFALFDALYAQTYSKGYLDSVKAFYSDWEQHQRDLVHVINDNTEDARMLELCVKQMNDREHHCPSFTIHEKIYKHNANYDVTMDRGTLTNDSIVLTQEEIGTLFKTIEHSMSFKWPKSIFPNAEIVSFQQYQAEMPKLKRPDKGIWHLSLPYFIRNGHYCIIFYLYYCGWDCGYESLIVYKNNDGKWKKYGTLMEALF